jgi:hypothetical protein
LYVFTHAGAEWRAEMAKRFDAILDAILAARDYGDSALN